MESTLDSKNCKIVIAGPGGGKTTCLVHEALSVLPQLMEKPQKFLTIITYTNAAADEIRMRLTKKIKIPENLFIGTCHSFLIRFIIEPFADILQLLPSEKSFVDQVNLPYNISNRFAKKNREISTASSLAKKGIIVYDKLFELSKEVLNNANALRIISSRLLFLFIDEYQDVRIHLHEIVKKIISQGRTTFFCIGDPLQSIYHFSYGQGQIRDERPRGYSFNGLPIIEFKKDLPDSFNEIANNYRSSPAIVGLNNLFLSEIEHCQIASNQDCKIPLLFISKDEIGNIYESFIDQITTYGLTGDNSSKRFALVMARQWRYLEELAVAQKLKKLDNSIQRGTSLFYELKRCVLGILGLKLSEAISFIPGESYLEQRLKFRVFCFKVYREIIIKEDDINNIQGQIIKRFVSAFCDSKQFSLASNSDFMNMLYSVKKLGFSRSTGRSDIYYSTIHTAKGLEANSVLVLAKTNGELQKWLTFNKITDVNNDNYRLGYVAFSRARKLLCFACLEKPTKKTLNLVASAGFNII